MSDKVHWAKCSDGWVASYTDKRSSLALTYGARVIDRGGSFDAYVTREGNMILSSSHWESVLAAMTDCHAAIVRSEHWASRDGTRGVTVLLHPTDDRGLVFVPNAAMKPVPR